MVRLGLAYDLCQFGGPAQNLAAGNNASGQKATHFSVLKALAGKELSAVNDQPEMVFVLFDTWVNFHLPPLPASQFRTKLFFFDTC